MPAADFGDFDGLSNVDAGSRGLNPTADQPEQAGFDPTFQHQVGAGVGHRYAWNRTLSTKIRSPGSAIRRSVNESAFLTVTAAVKILEVVGAFGPGWSAHSRILSYGA